MTILAFIFWVMIALFALGVFTNHKDTQTKNKVHFYVARDKDGSLWLYSGKPIKSRFSFVSGRFCRAVTFSDHFSKFGLNINDYDNLKWEDEPVEVFLNLEN